MKKLLAILCLLIAFVFTRTSNAQGAIVGVDIGTSTGTSTAANNECAVYDTNPEKMYTDDTFDKEIFVGIASSSVKNVPLSYLPVGVDASSTPIEGENFDITVFTPKTWYSHHPTNSTIYLVRTNIGSTSNTGSTSSISLTSTADKTEFVEGERYVIAGTFIANASSSAWTFADSLHMINNGSSTSKILLNNSCVEPMKVTQGIDQVLGQPLVSFDRYNYTRTLGLGMSGVDVGELNILLGVYPRYLPTATSTLSVDELASRNYFGKQTRTLLIDYQQTNAPTIGIRVATGFFGERTMAYVNNLQMNELNNELSCALPSNPEPESVSSLLYGLIPASSTIVRGNFEYASNTNPNLTQPVDLSYLVNTVVASTTSPTELAVATQSIASINSSLDVLLSRVNVGSSTQFIPFDSVKQFSRYFNRNSVAEGKFATFNSGGNPGFENVFFPRAIACARPLR